MQALFLATLIYFLVMPQLSSFMQLGLLIFLTAFLICYYYPLPQGYIPRTLSLVLLIVICSFDNQQSYSFIAAAQWYVVFPGILLVLGVASYFPVSNQPQPKLRRALKRYFSSCAFVIGSQGNASEGWISAYKLALHRSELEGLPAKLRSTAATLSADVFAENDQQTLNALLMVPSVLSARLLELNIALQTPLNIPDRALDREIKEWLGALESRFRALANQSIVSDPRADREQLVTKLARVEAHVAAVMNEDSRTVRLEDNDAMVLYRLLGAMRDVSQNYLEIATLAETVDWSRLWETRF